jgi:hypothetical protein
MTVGELIEKLKEYDPSSKVEIQKQLEMPWSTDFKYESLESYDFAYCKFNNVLEIGD